ncbi:Regulator of nonsense transcripts 1 [Beauveria bassiana]|uniref:Regulator of nonsense transcripts 1 n=1 Tax=Beauveria bassiana TaxID=176275 RepID=A0A2N6NM07_BEABA|nr:Regulator of nonsense transcripts 1 [Beauveria bassiana]
MAVQSLGCAQDVSLSREELDKIRLDYIRKRMAKLILPNIPYELTDKQRNGLTTAEARSALAADAIKTIITEHDQCPQEQRALLESWLEKNNTVQANTDDVSWTDIKWHGRRIVQVPGIVSGFQYYLLSTPKHSNWPPDLYPPPLRFVYDKPDVNGSVQALHDRLKLVIRTVIFYRAKVEVLKFKGHVCHAMNNLKDGSRGLHWWRYALNFNPAVAKTIKVNLLSEFPGIAAGLANGRFRALEKDTVLNGISKRTTALYTTSTNAMVNNAYAVFAERNPNRRAARAFIFREEVLAVLLYENMHRNEAQEETEQNTSSTPRHQAISVFRQHVENITQSNRELYSPRQHEHSLAATLIVGDPNQFRPIVPSYRKKLRCGTLAEKEDDVKVFEFDDLVSEQRRYPILARAQALHGVDFTLHENHRVYGSAGEYMSRNMFNGNMVCTHLGDCAASASLSENLVWFDLDDAVETAAGTSYINTAQARFCVELALQFCRECNFPFMTDWIAWKNGKLEKKRIRRGCVLIICMYAQQRELILSMLQQVPTHEYDLSRVEVRSVDQCLGHYGEVVIMSIGRSAGAGHTRDIKRSNVALTRHILFLATWATKLGNNLKSYRQYHSKHNLWKQIKGRHLWCEKCCQHGHSQERCDETLVCGFCRAPHAGRNCTKVPQDKTTVTDERWTEGATDKCWPPATEAVATAPAALTLGDGNKRLPSLDNLQRSVLYKAHAAQKGKQPKVIVCSTRNIAESQRRAI